MNPLLYVGGMNPLFVGLVVAGLALIIGVIVYNWLQMRRARRRTRRGASAGDVGGENAARDAGHGRAEPMLGSHGDAETRSAAQSMSVATMLAGESDPAPEPGESLPDTPPRPLGARSSRDAAAPDPEIECVVLLRPAQPVPTAALTRVLLTRPAKPARWLGRIDATLPWRAVDAAGAGPWREIAACMLLANRSGAASRDDIDAFLHAVEAVVADTAAECEWPDERAEADRAEALDRLCADLDVQIGLTILKGDQGQIAGTRLRGVAEAAGFHLTPAGQFDYLQEETGAVLYSLQNCSPEPFTVESLRALTVPGVVLLLDVPRVVDPARMFDQMRLVAKRFTQTLEGTLVDDNRRPLDDAALAAIRGQVQATAAALREAQIEPGGARALRLFS
jgi:hypothetical protein